MRTVFTIGEALIDFIPHQKGGGLKEVDSFRKAAGGAPANVACAVAKLGGRSSFIGKLGADAFGDFLVETMEQVGVDTRYVFRTSEANTALAFVSLKADGNREFSFYRNPSADMLLEESEIAGEWFGEGDILHFCSVDLIEAPVKYAHRKAIALAKAAGAVVSFDPNVRLPLWPDRESCRQTILEFLPHSHIVKISDEELAYITGHADEQTAIDSLFVGDVQHVVYTRGPLGAVWYARDFSVSVPGQRVAAIDTTGAGDAFVGSLLSRLAEKPAFARGIDEASAREMLAFANKAAAITVTRTGAIDSLPTMGEIERFR
ncbi:carbohydrate kinase family protein [Paenibacillus methanolicus]|uniref:Fructokinase n=1 Tax=Paenibacillus methanolicus TaxID=582686 RepID=A0A5S5BV66_9BACL|nr:carbohydrate kinase [Paenibacillus methanolicus]TYP71081.1 fructokinase [Paenibacillus methanolicus]